MHNTDFILARTHRGSWLNSIRRFVLDEAATRFPEATDGGCIMVKEPNGSMGAPLIMESMPESGMVFLIRNPGGRCPAHGGDREA